MTRKLTKIGLLVMWLAFTVFAQSSSRQYHVAGQVITTSLTSPTIIEGGSLNTSLTVDTLIIANTDSANAHTITIEDCQTPPFLLFNAYSVSAGSTWLATLAGTRFQSCLKWSATALTGTDLVIDGALNTKVTSATHNFTSVDVGKSLTISAGTGFTPGTYVINSVASNAAVLASAVGSVGSTGGTWSLPMMMGTIVGTH